jgi:hypothetical protein
VKNIRSRRHQKKENQSSNDRKEKGNSENGDVHSETMEVRAGIGIGEENGVDHQG